MLTLALDYTCSPREASLPLRWGFRKQSNAGKSGQMASFPRAVLRRDRARLKRSLGDDGADEVHNLRVGYLHPRWADAA